MTTFRFIHCSDLHIDSPFKGFSAINPDWAERLRDAPSAIVFEHRRLWRCVKRWMPSSSPATCSTVKTKACRHNSSSGVGLQTLSEHHIPAFIAHGNHDPLNTWSTTLKWPEGATVFPGSGVQSVPVVKDGQRHWLIFMEPVFPNAMCSIIWRLQFERQQDSGFAVAVLHANVGGHPDHDSLRPLFGGRSGIAGHGLLGTGSYSHLREVLRESHPAIVYCGNSQGRHFKESGPLEVVAW